MDSGDRFAPDALELFRRLAQAPESFGFFQVLRRVESTYRDQPRLGTTHRSAQEPVRLAQEPSLAGWARTSGARRHVSPCDSRSRLVKAGEAAASG